MRHRLLWAATPGRCRRRRGGCKPDPRLAPLADRRAAASWRCAASRPRPREGGDGHVRRVGRRHRTDGRRNPTMGWAQCLIPDPPANGNDFSRGCLSIPDDTTAPSPTFTAPLPANACTLFGPQTPPPMKGQPPTRPADPDITGGFYQPVRATWQSDAGRRLRVRAGADHLSPGQRADRRRRPVTHPTTSPTTTRCWRS